MVFKVKIQGEVTQISDQLKDNIEYFKDAEAIDSIADDTIEITTIKKSTWQQILQMSKIVDNKFPDAAKVNTSDLNEVLGNNELASFLKEKNYDQLNQLYQALHFLKMQKAKKSIVATLGCKVWIKQTFEDFQKKKEELGIKEELTTEKSAKMKETYPFMN